MIHKRRRQIKRRISQSSILGRNYRRHWTNHCIRENIRKDHIHLFYTNGTLREKSSNWISFNFGYLMILLPNNVGKHQQLYAWKLQQHLLIHHSRLYLSLNSSHGQHYHLYHESKLLNQPNTRHKRNTSFKIKGWKDLIFLQIEMWRGNDSSLMSDTNLCA